MRVDDDFRRQVSTTSLAASSRAVVSNWNALSLSVPWTPGGGALVVTASGQWLLETFEKYQDDAGGIDVGDYGYSQVRGGAEVLWRFLPRTSAVFSGGYFTRSPNSPTRADEATGFDLAAGITGLLTPRIAATAKVGYAATSAQRAGALSGATPPPSEDASTFVSDVGLEWLPLETMSVRAGYTRSLGVDPLASVYVADGVNGAVRVRVAARFAFHAGARYDRLKFTSISGAETSFLRVDPGIDGMVGKWLNVGVGYVYSTRVATWPAAPVPDYAKNEVFLKLGLTY